MTRARFVEAARTNLWQAATRVWGVVLSRLLIGFIVLVAAEVLSGSAVPMGLWHPWTILVTYWLYFAHFFFFTTLAVWTGRTALTALYLWGVLFGLYESWITKVIWAGYSGDGTLAMGRIGPYGFSEISMVFFFHPVMSFIVPLAVACVLYPPLRGHFPGLAWLTGTGLHARLARGYLVLSLAPIMAMNSGGLINLVANWLVVVAVLVVLVWASRGARAQPNADAVVIVGRPGFGALCIYLAVLYGGSYFLLRPEGLPSAPVQALTGALYAVALVGLLVHPRRDAAPAAPVAAGEARCVVRTLGALFALALVGTLIATITTEWLVVIALNFVVWTYGGFALTALCVLAGVGRRLVRTA